MSDLKCPCCPVCGSEPVALFGGGGQAFCPNSAECNVVMWDATQAAVWNLADMGYVSLKDTIPLD